MLAYVMFQLPINLDIAYLVTRLIQQVEWNQQVLR